MESLGQLTSTELEDSIYMEEDMELSDQESEPAAAAVGGGEDAPVKLEEDLKRFISQATQTAGDVAELANERESGADLEKLEDRHEHVQITASLSELLHRIDAFVQYKRHLVDVSNQIEFCHRSSADSTCARTDAAYIKRGPDPSHITTHRVQNTSGPSVPPLSPLEQLQHDLNPPPSPWNRFKSSRGVVSSSALLGLTERVSNIEQFTHLYGGGPTPRNLLQRIQNLEMRILELEGRSPEYFHKDTASKSLPQPKRITHPAIIPLPSGHPAHVT